MEYKITNYATNLVRLFVVFAEAKTPYYTAILLVGDQF